MRDVDYYQLMVDLKRQSFVSYRPHFRPTIDSSAAPRGNIHPSQSCPIFFKIIFLPFFWRFLVLCDRRLMANNSQRSLKNLHNLLSKLGFFEISCCCSFGYISIHLKYLVADNYFGKNRTRCLLSQMNAPASLTTSAIL